MYSSLVIDATSDESEPAKVPALAPKGDVVASRRAGNPCGLFAFQLASGRLWRKFWPATGTCGMMGFGVMRSPVGVTQRVAKGSQADRLLIESADVPRLRLREASKAPHPAQAVGLAFLRPQLLTKKHLRGNTRSTTRSKKVIQKNEGRTVEETQ